VRVWSQCGSGAALWYGARPYRCLLAAAATAAVAATSSAPRTIRRAILVSPRHPQRVKLCPRRVSASVAMRYVGCLGGRCRPTWFFSPCRRHSSRSATATSLQFLQWRHSAAPVAAVSVPSSNPRAVNRQAPQTGGGGGRTKVRAPRRTSPSADRWSGGVVCDEGSDVKRQHCARRSSAAGRWSRRLWTRYARRHGQRRAEEGAYSVGHLYTKAPDCLQPTKDGTQHADATETCQQAAPTLYR